MKKSHVFVLALSFFGIALVSMKGIASTTVNSLEIEDCEALSSCEASYEKFKLLCDGSSSRCSHVFKHGIFTVTLNCSGSLVSVSE